MRFDHIYEVRKFGATSIEQAILKVLIPTHLMDGDNKIDIVTINRTELSLPKTMINRHNSFCSNGTIEDRTEFKYDDNYSVEKINIKDNFMNVLTDDRTFYVNCSNPLIICTTIYCVLQTPLNLSTVAEIKFTMDLKIKNLRGNIIYLFNKLFQEITAVYYFHFICREYIGRKRYSLLCIQRTC